MKLISVNDIYMLSPEDKELLLNGQAWFNTRPAGATPHSSREIAVRDATVTLRTTRARQKDHFTREEIEEAFVAVGDLPEGPAKYPSIAIYKDVNVDGGAQIFWGNWQNLGSIQACPSLVDAIKTVADTGARPSPAKQMQPEQILIGRVRAGYWYTVNLS